MSNSLVLTDVPSFTETPVDLKKLQRDIAKHGKPAIDALVSLLDSKDEKTRLTAATRLLEFQVAIAKEINGEQLQRLIAQVKLTLAGGKKSLYPGEDDNTPLVDFTTIRRTE